MKSMSMVLPFRASLLVGVLALAACGVSGCGHSEAPAPLPAGVTPVDSSKPPPEMAAMYQRSQAAKAAASQPAGGQ